MNVAFSGFPVCQNIMDSLLSFKIFFKAASCSNEQAASNRTEGGIKCLGTILNG